MRTRQPFQGLKNAIATRLAGNALRAALARLRRGTLWLTLILALYVFLGMRFIDAVPLFEVPNEPWHFGYIRWLVDHHALPSMVESSDAWELGQAHQPPLYYAIGALCTRHIDTGPVEGIYVRNPHAALGRPSSHGNKNAVLATTALNPHYPDIVRAVRVLRGLCLVLSMITIALTYAIARTLVPDYDALALLAAALVAFNPQFLFVSSGVTNDALSIMLTTTTLYLGVRICSIKTHRIHMPILLGTSVGLGALTHWSGLISALVIVVAYGLRAMTRRERHLWNDIARPILIGAGVAVAIAGWWYLRNYLLYGDAMGFQSLAAVHPEGSSLIDSLRALVESSVSYWGVFGWMNILADEVFYDIVRILSALAGVGIILVAVRIFWSRHSLVGYRWAGTLLVGLWTTIIATTLVFRTQMLGGLEGRLFYPSIAPIAFFMAVGLLGWWSRYHAAWILVVPCALLCLVCYVAPSRYIAPAYARPPVMDVTEVPPEIHSIDIAYGDELFLLGYTLPTHSVVPGDEIEIDLFWLARKRVTTDYTFYVHVFGRSGERIGGVDTYPGAGAYPTSLWVPGDVIRDTWRIPVSGEAMAPTQGIVRVGAYNGETRESLTGYDRHGTLVGKSPEITAVRVIPATPFDEEPEQALEATFGKIDLWGYDLAVADAPDTTPPNDVIHSGDVLHITLYWHSSARMMADYTVFVHLVDDEGSLVAQIDEQPVHGDYPTHYWHVDERVLDHHDLALPDNTPPGMYSLRVGLYVLASGKRLAVAGTEPPATHVELASIRVESARR